MLEPRQIEWFGSVCLRWVDVDREDYNAETQGIKKTTTTHLLDVMLIHTRERKPIKEGHPLNSRIYYFCLNFFVLLILPIVIYAWHELLRPFVYRTESLFIDRMATPISNIGNTISSHRTSKAIKFQQFFLIFFKTNIIVFYRVMVWPLPLHRKNFVFFLVVVSSNMLHFVETWIVSLRNVRSNLFNFNNSFDPSAEQEE